MRIPSSPRPLSKERSLHVVAKAKQATKQAKAKAPRRTVAQVSRELDDLSRVANERQIRIRDLEVNNQKARDILKRESARGTTIQQDHYRLRCMIDDLRKLHGITDVG